MADDGREAWITGIGIASCLGEGPEQHWQRLLEGHPNADTQTYAPYPVHAIAPLNLDKQIPKKGDQRQMEGWQRIGTYAAGLALDSAGAKGNAELLSRMDMIVAAGGGERDTAVDSAILSGLPTAQDPEAFLNERLMSDLRPTLFLAQLSNLLAGNISIVHGVTGSSRTFMGEESAGVDAVRISLARIVSGQSDVALVGGAYNAERIDVVLHYVTGGCLWKGDLLGIWERAAKGGGMALGTFGAFLVLEEKASATKRGAKPLARLATVLSDHVRRQPGAVTATLERFWNTAAAQIRSDAPAVISGASGLNPATSEERDFFASHPELVVRATGTHLGHGAEPQFPMNIALASIALGHGHLFPPCDATGLERASDRPITQVVVTAVGHARGEGLALVEAVP
jgi:3-oxoacyl-[acyl-carrier-protein] synthase II